MAEDAPKPKPRGGCLSRLIVTFLLVVLCALGTGVFFVFQPQSLDDIQRKEAGPLRDLDATLNESLERGFPVTITEGQLNTWLSQRLALKQGGALSGAASFDHVWIRLEDGRAEVVTERKVFGRPLTVSLYLKVVHTEDIKGQSKEVMFQGGAYDEDFPTIVKGGRFGKLVVPQGFMHLAMPTFRKLAAAMGPEIEKGIVNMATIEIHKDRLILSPVAKEQAIPMPGSF